MMKKISFWFRKYYRLFRRLLFRAVNEPLPVHNIAMGFALGIFFGLGPTWGFQIVPFLFFALYFKYSKLAGILVIFISNPLTFIPIYLLEFNVGSKLLGNFVTVDVELFKMALTAFITEFNFSLLFSLGSDIVLVFLTGSFVFATFMGIVAYIISKILITRWRKRQHKILRWNPLFKDKKNNPRK